MLDGREQISLMDIDPKLSRPLLRVVATITLLAAYKNVAFSTLSLSLLSWTVTIESSVKPASCVPMTSLAPLFCHTHIGSNVAQANCYANISRCYGA